MTNKRSLAAHPKTSSEALMENTNMDSSTICLNVSLSLCVLTLVFSLYRSESVSSLFRYVAGPQHMHCPGNVALQAERAHQLQLTHIRLISFSALFAFINL